MRTTATTLHPLWNRAEEWRCRLAMIREATRFLYLSTYYLDPDRYGNELLTALIEAQRRGVAVHLLTDSFGQRLSAVPRSPEATAALESRLDELRAAGAVVTVYEPPLYLQRRLGGGQHVKIQISEAGEAIFGSSNVTASSFEHWNEYSVAVRGPVVHMLLDSFRLFGGTVANDHLTCLEQSAGRGPQGIALDLWLCNPNLHQGRPGPLGWRGRNLVTERMIEMLDAARERVRLTAFYFKPAPPLMRAVLAAARRGVRVEVYHSHRDALAPTDLAWIAAAASYDTLLAAGVQIFENLHGEHSKIVLVDERWVAFGGYNFEDAAHDRLAEAMLATRDERAVMPAVLIFDELRRDPDNRQVAAGFRRRLPPALRWRLALTGRFKRWM